MKKTKNTKGTEEKIKTFTDMIVPSIMKFNIDHFICGNTFRCVWAIREYPTSTDEQALLKHLGEKDGVTLHIYTRQVTLSEERKIIQNASNKIITDNCQLTLFGGFAPNSEAAEVLSKALGSKTIMSGSINRGKNDPSQSLQMIERPLITSDELKTFPKENFIVMKTGEHPMRVKLPLFFKWNILFDRIYETKERAERKVYYADKYELEENIMTKDNSEDLTGSGDNSDEDEITENMVKAKIEKENKKTSKEKSVLRT